MIINTKMIDILKNNYSLEKKVYLPNSLLKILNEGFIIHNDCYFIKYFFNLSTNVNNSTFKDKISYECFVNSFHIDDYVDCNYLKYSIVFCNLLLKKWYEFSNLQAKVIISLDEDLSSTIKFYIYRENELGFIDEKKLDNCIQPILISSNEINDDEIYNIILNTSS